MKPFFLFWLFFSYLPAFSSETPHSTATKISTTHSVFGIEEEFFTSMEDIYVPYECNENIAKFIRRMRFRKSHATMYSFLLENAFVVNFSNIKEVSYGRELYMAHVVLMLWDESRYEWRILDYDAIHTIGEARSKLALPFLKKMFSGSKDLQKFLETNDIQYVPKVKVFTSQEYLMNYCRGSTSWLSHGVYLPYFTENLRLPPTWEATVSLNSLLDFVHFLQIQEKNLRHLREGKLTTNRYFGVLDSNEKVDELYQFLFDAPRPPRPLQAPKEDRIYPHPHDEYLQPILPPALHLRIPKETEI